MVAELERRFYRTVSRYSSSAFTRMKMGDTLRRSTAPHLFETAADARQFLAERGR
jgi:propionate CoA-transferase